MQARHTRKSTGPPDKRSGPDTTPDRLNVDIATDNTTVAAAGDRKRRCAYQPGGG